MAASSVDAQIAGAFPGQGDPVPIELEVDLRPAVPPWMNGALLDDAKRVLDTQEEGDLMGHPWRFEQLCRATGPAPDRRRDLRHRRRRATGSAARASAGWPSSAATPGRPACFPSGRAFGYIAYPPRDDGKDTYNEGYLFDGDGDLIPARVVQAPWLQTLVPKGEDVSCVLETEDGRSVDDRRRDRGVDLHGDAAGRRRRDAAAAGDRPLHLGRRVRHTGCSSGRHRRPGWPGTAPSRTLIDPDELLATAQERTGLDDFGDDSFREGLERPRARRCGPRRRSTPSARSCSPS